MKCLTCSNEVSSKFAFAIASNCCPFCGDLIMQVELQKILNGLHDVMTSATKQSFEDQALNWMTTNFNLVSRDAEEIVELHNTIEKLTQELQTTREKYTKPIPRSGQIKQADLQLGVDELGEQVQLNGPALQDQGATQAFMDRANNNKFVDKNASLKNLAKQIRSGGAIDGGNMVITPEILANAEEMEQMLSPGVPVIASGIVNYEEDGALPPIAEAFIAGSAGGGGQAYNAKDMASLAKMQQKMARERGGDGDRPNFGKR